MTVPERIIDKIRERITVAEGGCWMWPGAKVEGYGRIAWSEDKRMQYALVHRAMYSNARGEIAPGLDIDHLCHSPEHCALADPKECPHRACCNPDHLQAVSRQTNLLRGGTVTAKRRATTHCPKGHEYTEANTIRSKRGQRTCRTCAKARSRAYYQQNRERMLADNKAYRDKRARLRTE